MKIKKKKSVILLLLAVCMLVGYWLWLSLRPVEIVGVHHRSNGFSDVLVISFPPTDKGKINWWLKNQKMLKDKYAIPAPEKDGYFHINFWLFGKGYKEEEKYDRLCFSDMNTNENCIEKNAVLSVSNSVNLGVIFTVYNGMYQLKKDGTIVEYKLN